LQQPGRYADGNGLYLRIGKDGRRVWVFTFRWDRRLSDKGLGSANSVSLAEARKKAGEARRLLGLGFKPTEDRRPASGNKPASVRTFSACAGLGERLRNVLSSAQSKFIMVMSA
jgi:hypothetical protein